MGNKTGTTKLARRIQRVAEEETGARPKYTSCYLLAQTAPNMPGRSLEERATQLFMANRERFAPNIAKILADAENGCKAADE